MWSEIYRGRCEFDSVTHTWLSQEGRSSSGAVPGDLFPSRGPVPPGGLPGTGVFVVCKLRMVCAST